MSLTSNLYDVNNYKRNLQGTIGQGNYTLNNSNEHCNKCSSPDIPNSSNGNSTCNSCVDVDSELIGLNVKNTKCASRLYLPSNEEFCDFKDETGCPVFTGESTRLSNPPCTLRGTGWNRWEWLCQNPQDKAIEPHLNVLRQDTRLMTKDEHRACIPNLLEQGKVCPKSEYNDPEVVMFDDREITYGTLPIESESFSSQNWVNCVNIN
jgi:hypothetical protein|tara:strand:+ start:4260 stop:4880 length:621 start_codon:yes stop_codon:yes gene_type:complete